MIIIHNKIIPFGDYSTMNLFGILFTKSKTLSDTTINHESIHTEQMKEMGFIFFYIWYIIEYLIVQCFHNSQSGGYHDISFEEEAYNNQNNLDYIKTRKHYNWKQYLKIKSNGLKENNK